MTQYAFFFDSSRCTGCRTCELACKDYKDLDIDTAFRKIYDYEGGQWSELEDETYTCTSFVYHFSLACNHCDNPACTKVCPTGAMHKDSDTGLVSVNSDKCIGCGYCHMACPYNVPKVDRSAGHTVKCDGCSARVAQGLDPICVGACPLRALEFGTQEEMSAKGERANIAPLPESSYTNPNLYIKTNDDAEPAGTNVGIIANVSEVI